MVEEAVRRVFISYAREDNRRPPDDPGTKGFVSFLHDRLQFELGQLGEPCPELWLDTKEIERGQQFEPLLSEGLAEASLLLIVLSRNWVSRTWCLRELDEFVRGFRHEDERHVRERIVVVGKHNVSADRRFKFLQGQEGYDLFELDKGKESPFFVDGRIVNDRYKDLVRELATYVWHQVQGNAPRPALTETRIRLPPARPDSPIREPPPNSASPPRTIFLAKPARDMEQAYVTLVKELAGRGYRVVPEPETDLPEEDPDATTAIDEALLRAEISIHLLGAKVGYTPTGATLAIAPLQLERAARRIESPQPSPANYCGSFHRLVWAPREIGTLVDRDPQTTLAQFGKECGGDRPVGEPLPDFVQFAMKHLEAIKPRPSHQVRPGCNGTTIYLYHDEGDDEIAVDLADQLQKEGLNLLLPAYGDPSKHEELHKRELARCDSVVLCWANASSVWIRAHAGELQDWQCLGRGSPFACRGVAECPPPQRLKDHFRRVPPRTDIDLVVNLTDEGSRSAEMQRLLLALLGKPAELLSAAP